jgi:hypothetical protein
MKARFSDDARRGFITVEIMIAAALMSVVFVGALLADRGVTYWTLSAQTGGETLASAQSDAVAAQSSADRDFFHVVSSFVPDAGTAPCAPNVPCDGIRRTVTDFSPCAKEVRTETERQIFAEPEQTAALTVDLADPAEATALGGDCDFSAPDGDWAAPTLRSSFAAGSGSLTGLDVFHGIAYATADVAPFLRIVTTDGPVAFANGFMGAGPFNDIDVAQDVASGHIYAYVAAVSPQFQIIDVTDPANPRLAGSATLADVTLTGAQAQAWRVTVYDRTAYVAARYMISANPELHLFDVSTPSAPREIGAGFKLSTSVYDIIINDQLTAGVRRRFAFFATTSPAGELKVFDVTDSAAVAAVASCDLPGDEQATSLFLLGTVLYVGRDTVPNGGADLYAFDASDPTASSFCVPLGKTDITTDHYSRHVEALRAAGPYLFVATTNTTDAHGEIQVRDSDPTTDFTLLGTYEIPALAEHALDFDDDSLYAAGTASPQVQTLAAP